MLPSFGTLAVFVGVALGIPAATLGLSLLAGRALGVRRPHAAKDDTYESGMPTRGPAWVQFRVQYYLYALIFVLFDVEILFVVPWAVAYRRLDHGFAVAEIALFVGVLLAGLGYAWRRGALRWE